MKRLLLLAGTAEARQIAAALRDRFEVIASLAGATSRPSDLGVPTRTGGFGGAEGLRRHVETEGTDLLIDATHPFAAQMKANAAAQAIPRLHVIRPPWSAAPDEAWTVVPDLEAAARALPADARAFLALGGRHLDAFRGHPAAMVVRSIDAPTGDDFTFVRGAPGSVAEETALLRGRRISHLVCRNSGGTAGRAKLDAARALGLTAIVVGRPAPPPGEIVETAEAAVRWALARAGD